MTRTGPDGTPATDGERDELRQRVVRVLDHVYGPILAGLVFAWLFVTQDPAQEAILGFAAEFAPLHTILSPEVSLSEAHWRSLFGTLLLWAIPVMVWSGARLAVRPSRYAATRLGRWIPVAAGLGVYAAILFGLRKAALSGEAGNIPDGRFTALALWGIAGLGYGAALHWSIHRLAGVTLLGRRRPDGAALVGLVLTLLLLFVPVVWIGLVQPWRASLFGPVGITAAFVIAAGYGLAVLTALSQSAPFNFPLILILGLMVAATSLSWPAWLLAAMGVGGLLYILLRWLLRGRPDLRARLGQPPHYGAGTVLGLVLIALFGLSAGYLSRPPPPCGSLSGCNLLPGVERRTFDAVPLTQSFKGWEGRDAPVVRMVTAQGGGLFAAYEAAYYLAARADADPDFTSSLFSISGVSGGSVGAGVFWAVRRSGLCDGAGPGGTCHRDAVRAILRHDYLSPTLAAFFFRDALDTVVPISYLFERPIDRASVLEARFASRVGDWAEAEAARTGRSLPEGFLDAPLGTALSDSWSPGGDLPLLMFNATEVGTGARRILSPLPRIERFTGDSDETPDDRPDLKVEIGGRVPLLDVRRDLSVGNAMTISARFPIVTPPARIRQRGPDGAIVVRQLVDGGYFDNSGIETLIEQILTVRDLRGRRPVEMLVLSVAEAPPEVTLKGTVAAPLDAFASAWRARRDLTAQRLRDLIATMDGAAGAEPEEEGDILDSLSICPVVQQQLRTNFTVSWFLTEDTFRDIEIQMDAKVTGTEAQADRDLCFDGPA